MKDKIKGKEFMIIRIPVKIEERKVTDDRNDYCREGQKGKRKDVPMHNKWPAKKAKRFYMHGNLMKSKEIQGNCNVNKITDVSPLDQFTNHVLFTFLLTGEILDIYKKYLGNREQYEIMHKIDN